MDISKTIWSNLVCCIEASFRKRYKSYRLTFKGVIGDTMTSDDTLWRLWKISLILKLCEIRSNSFSLCYGRCDTSQCHVTHEASSGVARPHEFTIPWQHCNDATGTSCVLNHRQLDSSTPFSDEHKKPTKVSDYLPLGSPTNQQIYTKRSFHVVASSYALEGDAAVLFKGPHYDIKPFFSWNCKEIVFSYRLLNAKIHMAFSMFSVDARNRVKMKNELENSVLVLDFISAQLGQFTISDFTHQHSREVLIRWTIGNIHC